MIADAHHRLGPRRHFGMRFGFTCHAASIAANAKFQSADDSVAICTASIQVPLSAPRAKWGRLKN